MGDYPLCILRIFSSTYPILDDLIFCFNLNCRKFYRAADWGLFIEVGEHIPTEFEYKVFNTVSEIARTGLIVSWASPGQRGYKHINCHDADYVVDQFSRRRWELDEEATELCGSIAKRFKHKLRVFRI